LRLSERSLNDSVARKPRKRCGEWLHKVLQTCPSRGLHESETQVSPRHLINTAILSFPFTFALLPYSYSTCASSFNGLPQICSLCRDSKVCLLPLQHRRSSRQRRVHLDTPQWHKTSTRVRIPDQTRIDPTVGRWLIMLGVQFRHQHEQVEVATRKERSPKVEDASTSRHRQGLGCD
jgi:hypothetical protein